MKDVEIIWVINLWNWNYPPFEQVPIENKQKTEATIELEGDIGWMWKFYSCRSL